MARLKEGVERISWVTADGHPTTQSVRLGPYGKREALKLWDDLELGFNDGTFIFVGWFEDGRATRILAKVLG